jgi:hypothetical protein
MKSVCAGERHSFPQFLTHNLLTYSYARTHTVPERKWRAVGVVGGGRALSMQDLTWPGGGPSPPQGTPDKFHIKVNKRGSDHTIVLNILSPNLTNTMKHQLTGSDIRRAAISGRERHGRKWHVPGRTESV